MTTFLRNFKVTTRIMTLAILLIAVKVCVLTFLLYEFDRVSEQISTDFEKLPTRTNGLTNKPN